DHERQPHAGCLLQVRRPRAPRRLCRRPLRCAGHHQPGGRDRPAQGRRADRRRTGSHESRAESQRASAGQLNARKGKMTMARKIYPYSLDRKDAKIAGVASTIGAMTGIDPTFIRVGFVAAAIFISFKLTLVAYAAIGIYLAVQKKKSMAGERRMSDFDRMGQVAERRPTTHAMVHDLDETDRRLMAIDHHIN